MSQSIRGSTVLFGSAGTKLWQKAYSQKHTGSYIEDLAMLKEILVVDCSLYGEMSAAFENETGRYY